MISSQKLATILYNDLDQNAYTSRYDDPKIIEVINTAVNFVCAYAKWPFTLTSEEVLETTKTKTFTLENEAFFPYRIALDETEKDLTAIPITPTFRTADGSGKAYVLENVVSTSEEGLKLNILYHKGFNHIDTLGVDDIFLPKSMFQPLVHICLWFLYPSGLDIGSSLANQHYQMAKTLLDTYAKAYGTLIQPKKVEAANIYTQM